MSRPPPNEQELVAFRKLGAEVAESMIADMGRTRLAPAPFPTTREGIPAFVDAIAPGAVEQIGASLVDRPMAVPEAIPNAIEDGFRTRLTALLNAALG